MRINKPLSSVTTDYVWLLIHAGYDFDPTTLAVCVTQEDAEALQQAHYAVEEHKDFPWNGTSIVKAQLNNWVPYKEETDGTDE